jgi:CRP/FNR family cyclic AMP-dependent transcriptional regulator
MKNVTRELQAQGILFREGESSHDLFYLREGELLVVTVSGTQVKAIARIAPGEFIGELSFFDGKPRATHVIATRPSVLIQIARKDLLEQLPFWFQEVGKNLTKKIRHLDAVVNESNLRRGAGDLKPLTIEEQRQILAVLK